jgi:hypothetical protein
MSLSWNEIKERAIRFSKEWENACNEEAEAKPFLVDFFNVFGISQRKVATFEHKVKKLDEHEGYIDMLWKGTLLIEMKSRGKNLDKAYEQARDYLHGLPQHELPKYILISDFERYRLFDLEEDTTSEFLLKELVKHVHLFGFIAGYQKRTFKEEDPVNIEAAELMGKLHDSLKAIGYTGHDLERYLVRLLFCLFADDTGIFEKGQFQEYILNKTNIDGSDLPYHLAAIFNVLNIPREKRLTNLDESLAVFPYVNGKLFEETLPMASFDSRMRQTLLECCTLDWSKISPAIFGSLFQSVMDEKARRNLGAHYTSEKNILKVIKPLFLDGLWKDFDKVKDNRNRLLAFHERLAGLRFLDPACGCGNFLVISYRELRILELEIIKVLQKGQMVTDIAEKIKLDVDRFYGIELEEFPSQIAQVAMWLVDHQMNIRVSETFGQYFVRLPLIKSANIICGNALRIDWDSLLIPEKTISIHAKEANIIQAQVHETDLIYGKVNVFAEKINITDKPTLNGLTELKFNYIFGNPPFSGKQLQNTNQKSDMDLVFGGVKGSGVLDFVTCWYIRAAQYLKQYNSSKQEVKCAFVSTNSVAQGEQVGVLWNELFNHYKIKIHFAHRTFKWSNEAKGVAAVHVVIIGFANFDIDEKFIYEYEDIKGEPHELKVRNLNPYLVEGKDVSILSKSNSICNGPKIVFGSMPNDGGFLLLSENEKIDYIKNEPLGEKFIRPFTGGEEFIKNIPRYCFWLKDANINEIRSLSILYKRIQKVREFRLSSKRPATNKLAEFPTLFGEIRQPNSKYIIIPNLSSGLRKYIPIGFKSELTIVSNLALIIPNANNYHLGILTSIMHMVWVRYTCGMLSTSLRYSNNLVYNNFPWPENPADKHIKAVEAAAQKVLDTRAEFPGSSLADLYNPLTMPPALVKAHQALDKAVDQCYRPQPFINDTKRIEYLFELYDKYTVGLL